MRRTSKHTSKQTNDESRFSTPTTLFHLLIGMQQQTGGPASCRRHRRLPAHHWSQPNPLSTLTPYTFVKTALLPRKGESHPGQCLPLSLSLSLSFRSASLARGVKSLEMTRDETHRREVGDERRRTRTRTRTKNQEAKSLPYPPPPWQNQRNAMTTKERSFGSASHGPSSRRSNSTRPSQNLSWTRCNAGP